MLAILRAIALILAFIAAAVPSQEYIKQMNRDWLWLMIGVNIFAYVMVALTTIQTTLDVAGRDSHKLPVPARFEHTPILAKWWAGVRLTWHWHALAALARLGLAHGLAQHIHVIQQTMNDFQGIISPFFAATYYSLEGYYSTSRAYWLAGIIGGVVLVLISVAETGLITAMTLYMWKPKEHKSRLLIKTALLRLGLIIGLIVVMLGVQNVYKTIGRSGTASDDPAVRKQFSAASNFILPPLKVAHRIGFTLLDDGTMMASEIMVMHEGLPMDLGCDLNLPRDTYVYSCWQSGRIIHRLLFTGGALLLYAALTGFCLWLAQRRYRRQSSSIS
jgi:hypothetical protein